MANIVFPFNYKIAFNNSNVQAVLNYITENQITRGFEVRIYSKCILVSGSRQFYEFREHCNANNIIIEKEW